MSFLSDPSAVVLIIGAIAIVAFLVHGLWFSGKPENRRLSKNDKRDEKLRNNSEVGKVRIVTTDAPAPAAAGSSESAGRIKSADDVSSVVIEEIPKDAVPNSAKDPAERRLPQNIEINLVAEPGRPYRGSDIEALCAQYGILRGDLDIYYVYENPQAREHEVFRMCSLVSPFSFPQDMIHRIDIINIQGTEIQDFHGFSSLS